MHRHDRIRLQHMLDAACEAVQFSRGRSRVDLEQDRLLAFGLVKAIEIVGEAAHQVGEDTRKVLTDIPWDDIVGMRHRLVHAYFDINLDILWATVEHDLPPLIEKLRASLERVQSEGA